MRNLTFLTFVTVVMLALPAPSEAIEVAIVNPGFEDSELGDGGWDYMSDNEGWGFVDNGGSLGSWNISEPEYPGNAPEGQNVGWAEPGTGITINGEKVGTDDKGLFLWNVQLRQENNKVIIEAEKDQHVKTIVREFEVHR